MNVEACLYLHADGTFHVATFTSNYRRLDDKLHRINYDYLRYCKFFRFSETIFLTSDESNLSELFSLLLPICHCWKGKPVKFIAQAEDTSALRQMYVDLLSGSLFAQSLLFFRQLPMSVRPRLPPRRFGDDKKLMFESTKTKLLDLRSSGFTMIQVPTLFTILTYSKEVALECLSDDYKYCEDGGTFYAAIERAILVAASPCVFNFGAMHDLAHIAYIDVCVTIVLAEDDHDQLLDWLHLPLLNATGDATRDKFILVRSIIKRTQFVRMHEKILERFHDNSTPRCRFRFAYARSGKEDFFGTQCQNQITGELLVLGYGHCMVDTLSLTMWWISVLSRVPDRNSLVKEIRVGNVRIKLFL